MNLPNLPNSKSLALGATVWLATAASAAMGGQPIPFTWKATHIDNKWQAMIEEKAAGRSAFFFTNRTTDRQTVGGNLIDGNSRVNTGYWEFGQGRGLGSGFSRAEKGGDVYMLEWNGVCYSVSGSDGKAVTRCGGGWFFSPGSGTGRFANIKGGGSWSGVVQPNGDFEEEGSGYIEQ